MANYFTDVFSPETYRRFLESDRTISGFRARQRAAASRVAAGDIFVCYLTRVSRWVGLQEVVEGPFESAEMRFVEDGEDPFILRFRVRPLVQLIPEEGIPISEDRLWSRLSFTRELPKSSKHWTGQVRASLNRMKQEDGRLLEGLLKSQASQHKAYPFDEADLRALMPLKVNRAEGQVAVTVPTPDVAPEEEAADVHAPRESIKVQALLARIGSTMGFKIWLPASDRGAVMAELKSLDGAVVPRLPLNYDETTLRTIENIDLLWLKGRSIVRAFEIEHTTSIYSGLLRMADLLALQPNMDIRLHIVAPDARREKVHQEISRPVFTLLERAPLKNCCSYLSYDSVREIGALPHLAHLSDSVLEDYEEFAE